MAFTREFIRNAAKESGVEIPKEMEDALVQEHLSARDAYAGEQVKAALETNKQEPAQAVKETQEYKDLEQKYKDLKTVYGKYKTEQDAKEVRVAREKAFLGILKDASITSEQAVAKVLKYTNLDSDDYALDENGKFKDAKKILKSVQEEWPEQITRETVRGADTPAPPANNGGRTMTREEIFKTYGKDPAKCQEAIAANMDLFVRRE